MSAQIHFPTDEENAAALAEFVASQQKISSARKLATQAALPALSRLIDVCSVHSGQSYKVRALLFSAWNGKAVSLSETLCLDWQIKQDLFAVLLAFGADDFFYDELSGEFKRRGLLAWFLEERTP